MLTDYTKNPFFSKNLVYMRNIMEKFQSENRKIVVSEKKKKKKQKKKKFIIKI